MKPRRDWHSKKEKTIHSLLIVNEVIYRLEIVLALKEKCAILVYTPDLLGNHYSTQRFSFPAASYWTKTNKMDPYSYLTFTSRGCSTSIQKSTVFEILVFKTLIWRRVGELGPWRWQAGLQDSNYPILLCLLELVYARQILQTQSKAQNFSQFKAWMNLPRR